VRTLPGLIKLLRAVAEFIREHIAQQVQQIKEPSSSASSEQEALQSTDCQDIADQLAAAQALLDQAVADLAVQQSVVDSLTGLVAGLQTSLEMCLQQSNP